MKIIPTSFNIQYSTLSSIHSKHFINSIFFISPLHLTNDVRKNLRLAIKTMLWLFWNMFQLKIYIIFGWSWLHGWVCVVAGRMACWLAEWLTDWLLSCLPANYDYCHKMQIVCMAGWPAGHCGAVQRRHATFIKRLV